MDVRHVPSWPASLTREPLDPPHARALHRRHDRGGARHRLQSLRRRADGRRQPLCRDIVVGEAFTTVLCPRDRPGHSPRRVRRQAPALPDRVPVRTQHGKARDGESFSRREYCRPVTRHGDVRGDPDRVVPQSASCAEGGRGSGTGRYLPCGPSGAMLKADREAAMGFYDERVLPRIINVACGAKTAQPLRRRACASLEGEVLEVGFGTGHNVPFYPEAVTRVAAVEPSDAAWIILQRPPRFVSRRGATLAAAPR